MTWAEVCANPILQNLPFKIELNEWGQIVMSPASNRHGEYQAELGIRLRTQSATGKIISECSVQTSHGVRVADVAWASPEFVQTYGSVTPYEHAPELCVEIVSPSNTKREMDGKCALYFKVGAKEVWLCSEEGEVSFFTSEGQLAASKLFPRFPTRI